MNDSISFNLSHAAVLKAIEEHLNRTLFKVPMHLTDIAQDKEGDGFDVIAEPQTTEPRSTKPKTDKASKRGLKAPVLEQTTKPNGATRNEDISAVQEQQEA